MKAGGNAFKVCLETSSSREYCDYSSNTRQAALQRYRRKMASKQRQANFDRKFNAIRELPLLKRLPALISLFREYDVKVKIKVDSV